MTRATFSDDECYRYTLWREVEGVDKGSDRGTVVFIMLNPSTADASKNDPTIRKCLDFARGWRFGRLEVVNLFAYRSPKPRTLAHVQGKDITGGSRNDQAIEEVVQKGDLIVCAWGGGSSLPTIFKRGVLRTRSKEVLELVSRQGKQPYTISAQLTVSGQPQHPRSLNFPDDTKPKLWEESRWPRN